MQQAASYRGIYNNHASVTKTSVERLVVAEKKIRALFNALCWKKFGMSLDALEEQTRTLH